MSSLSVKGEKKQDEIGGTNLIARGTSGAEAIQTRRQLKETKLKDATDAQKERISHYYHNGPSSSFHNAKRRKHAREDDENPSNMDRLNPAQKRALVKRQQMGDRRVKANVNRIETKRLEAAIAAADAELVLHTEESGFLETETEMEKTYHMTQDKLRTYLDEQTTRHIFDLNLTQYCPYGMNYDRSGRCGLLFGKRGGHVALMDMHTNSLKTEFFLNEPVRDAIFLHNTTLFAVAQKNHAFIYDDSGIEIHRMDKHNDVMRMQFLPYHWLLATVNRSGFLKYHDTSTGSFVSEHRTKMGPCNVMTQNKSNAVIHCGHLNGVISLWSPANSEYLVKMLCHKGAAIQDLAVDQSGKFMVTGGADSQIKIWDLRMYKEIHAYFCRGGMPTSIDISQKGVLGIGHGPNTTFWSPEALKYKVKDPYLTHQIAGKGPVETLRFRPFEDVCGIGHAKGFSSIVIPGSGEPQLDSMEYNVNPYQDTKRRREAEVHALLDKLSPAMIALDPDVIATVEENDHHMRMERHQQKEEEANARKDLEGANKPKEKKRMRGRGKIQKRLNRKKKNIIDENIVKLREAREEEKAKKAAEKEGRPPEKSRKEEAPSALKRFFK